MRICQTGTSGKMPIGAPRPTFARCGELVGRKAMVTWSHVRAHRSRILVKYLYHRISGFVEPSQERNAKTVKWKIHGSYEKYNKFMKTLFNKIY